MEYLKFIIKKFKGIDEITIDLTRKPQGRIFPFVGLNESGKTTILEAINFLQKDIENKDRHTLIHKRDKGSFSGFVEVTCVLALHKYEINEISKICSEYDEKMKSVEDIELNYTKKYRFIDGIPEDETIVEHSFRPGIKTKKSGSRTFNNLNTTQESEIFESIKDKIPKIHYYPDFLFDFPEKIYLDQPMNTNWDSKEISRQLTYKAILKDILLTFDQPCDLTSFITKLKNKIDEGNQESAEAIKRMIEIELNKKIIDPWKKIFPDSITISIDVTTGNDGIGEYLQLKINEGGGKFGINERSLGFKWFFGFLFSTLFRNVREDEYGESLFLFDEPANNLHQSSQQKLLDSFQEISKHSKILYSTHSHYLLNTKLILNTIVVKDEGRSNKNDYDYRQNIKALPYSSFITKYTGQDQETHFKPVLDILEFVENPFIAHGKILFSEGKFDYYTFKLIQSKFFNTKDYKFNFYPGGGVDHYENIFREYLANNRIFYAIFDSDQAGINAKKKYLSEISQELEKNIFTLADVSGDFDNLTTEKLFTEEDQFNIQKKSFPESTVSEKSKFNTAIQELFINNEEFGLSTETIENFKKIFDFIKDKFNEQS
jgi:energy-coupling factor transporter ATP-binding protein EcfA2